MNKFKRILRFFDKWWPEFISSLLGLAFIFCLLGFAGTCIVNAVILAVSFWWKLLYFCIGIIFTMVFVCMCYLFVFDKFHGMISVWSGFLEDIKSL